MSFFSPPPQQPPTTSSRILEAFDVYVPIQLFTGGKTKPTREQMEKAFDVIHNERRWNITRFKSEKFTVDKLPDDVIPEIFQHFTKPEEFYPLASLEGFHRALEHPLSYKNTVFVLRDLNELKKIKVLVKVQILHIYDKHITDWEEVLGKFPKLRELVIRKSNIAVLPRLPPDIKSLWIDGDSFGQAVINFYLDDHRLQNYSSVCELKKLENLKLTNHVVGSIETLKSLRIKELNISDNSIDDFTPLETLKNLQRLNLMNTKFRNNSFTHLFGLTNLKELNLSRNNLTNVGPLEKLSNLESLDLSYMEDYENSRSTIRDYGPLASLKNLKELIIRKSGLHSNNIRFLMKLTVLERLDLSDNHIKNVKIIGNLENLIKLNLSKNNIEIVKPLGNLKNLIKLYLSVNGIKDPIDLRKLFLLRELDLAENPIMRFIPLKNFMHLKKLNLKKYSSGDRIKVLNISPLRVFPHHGLRELVLKNHNRIRDFTPLRNLRELEILDLSGTTVNHYSGWKDVSTLKRLIVLNLTNSHIGVIPNMGNFKDLKTLFIGQNKIRDLGPLSKLKELTHLDISRNYFELTLDLTPLVELTQLRTLDLSETYIKTIKPLFGLSNLKHLSLKEIKASDLFGQRFLSVGLKTLTVKITMDRNESKRLWIEKMLPNTKF